jgi:DNA-binding transcriptional LysR family regulator
VNSGNALYEALLAGVGISRVANALAVRDLQAGKLIRLLEDYEDDTDGGIYVVFPSDRYLLPKVQVFVEFLVKSFPKT